MKKLLSLLTLLLTMGSAAWAQTTLLTYTIPESGTVTAKTALTAGDGTVTPGNEWKTSKSGDGWKLDGDPSSSKASSKYVLATLASGQTFKEGDIISITGYSATNASAASPQGFTLYDGAGGSTFIQYGHAVTTSASKNTSFTVDFKIESSSSLIGKSAVYVFRYFPSGSEKGVSASFQGITITRPSSTPVATYTVTYKANGGTGDDIVEQTSTVSANTFIAPEGKVFAGWNTAADGTGTAYAAGNAVTENLTLYAQWADAPTTVTLFSMSDITGPTSKVDSQNTENVTATFSTGGSAQVFNGHASSAATFVTGNTLNLNSSLASYLHIMLPTILKAGDVISVVGLGDKDKIKISASTSGAATKTFPYTITSSDALVGKTDVYFFKDGSASFTSVTIEGDGEASDLTITSGRELSLGTGDTNDITFTSSNTGAVTYTSSAPSVATVSAEGTITAVAPGTATITVSQASDGTIRDAQATIIVTVERTRKATEVTGEFVLDTENGTQSSDSYVTKDGSVYFEGKLDKGSSTSNDLKNSHFKHSYDLTFTLPTNYPVSTVWFVGYGNGGESTPKITLKKVDGEAVTEQSATIGGSNAIPTADCAAFKLENAATESMVINVSEQCRGYFILNPAAQDITLTQVGTKYYASYYSAGEMAITGATAYTAVLDAENSKLTLTECEGGVVPARTGVILIGDAETATATPSFTGAEKAQSALIGVAQKEVAMTKYYGSTSAADKVFVLGADNGKVGLYKYTGATLGVGKAYLYNETLAAAGARSLSFEFEGETTTVKGIETVKAELKKYFENGKLVINSNGEKYNAAGQQIR